MIKPMYHYVSAAIASEHGWGWWSCQIKFKFKLSCLLHEDNDALRNSDNAFSRKGTSVAATTVGNGHAHSLRHLRSSRDHHDLSTNPGGARRSALLIADKTLYLHIVTFCGSQFGACHVLHAGTEIGMLEAHSDACRVQLFPNESRGQRHAEMRAHFESEPKIFSHHCQIEECFLFLKN